MSWSINLDPDSQIERALHGKATIYDLTRSRSEFWFVIVPKLRNGLPLHVSPAPSAPCVSVVTFMTLNVWVVRTNPVPDELFSP